MKNTECLEREIHESQADLERQLSVLKHRVETRFARPMQIIQTARRAFEAMTTHPIAACIVALALGTALAWRTRSR